MLWVRVWTHEARMSIYLKPIGKSKALIATLSDTEPEVDSEDSDQEGKVSASTTTVDLSKEFGELVDEEKELMESKFEEIKMISILLTQSFTRILRSMKSFIG